MGKHLTGEYAKYRDIYPKEFYAKLAELSLGVKGQNVLDLGTGTGVIPRNMYSYGAKWTGADISENQIMYAEKLSKSAGMDIDYIVASAEAVDYQRVNVLCILTNRLSCLNFIRC